MCARFLSHRRRGSEIPPEPQLIYREYLVFERNSSGLRRVFHLRAIVYPIAPFVFIVSCIRAWVDRIK